MAIFRDVTVIEPKRNELAAGPCSAWKCEGKTDLIFMLFFLKCYGIIILVHNKLK